MEENKAKDYTDIWSFDKEVLEKNDDVRKELHDIPDPEYVAENVHGYVINGLGNIVAKFGFFVELADKQTLDIRISKDGFLAGIYNKPTNIILGYGHPLGFPAIVDPQQSQILHLGPEQANGEEIIISIENDEKLKEQGITCIIRDTDVMLEVLSPEVRKDFEESLVEASQPVEELNEIEKSYNSFIVHMHSILGQEFNTTK